LKEITARRSTVAQKPATKVVKAARQAEADANTTPTLHFLTGRAYHVSARSLMKNPPPRLSHKDAPVRSLLHHAVELYLKAFLLKKGMTPDKLRGKDGHNYERLVEEAQKRGLGLDPAFENTLIGMQFFDVFSTARYQSGGGHTIIPPEALNDLCNALAALVGRAVLGTIPKAQSHIVRPI
jgi:hypothetical protein